MENTKPTVVVIDHRFAHLQQEAAAAAAAGADFRIAQCRVASEVEAACEGARVAVVQFAPVTEAALARLAPGARVIRYGVGFDNIDVRAATAKGIVVAYVPDYCTAEVADHTAALALALVRRVPQLDAAVRGGTWDVLATAPQIAPADEVTCGFLGLGRIGRETLQRLRPFGWRFLVHDPALPADEAARLGVEPVATPDGLFERANLLVLHLPLTASTRHVVDARAIGRMPHGALLVNTARGGLVDEEALAGALRSGALGGAAIDVFEQEPLPAASPLRAAPNLLLTPHAGWYSSAAVTRLQGMVADEITRALRGEPPRCPVPGTGVRGA